MSLRHAILGVLQHGPRHGYRVLTELEGLVAGGRFNSAQVYDGLRWLADRGFVTASPAEPGSTRDRRPFTITPKGRQEFSRWLRTPIAPLRPTRDDAVMKVVFLGREEVERLVERLERLRKMHARRLTIVRPRRADPGETTTALLLELSAAALHMREEAEIRWIDHCLDRLRSDAARAQASPIPTEAGESTPPRVAALERRDLATHHERAAAGGGE